MLVLQDDEKAVTLTPDEARDSTSVYANTDGNSNDTSTIPDAKAETPNSKSEDTISQRSSYTLSASPSRYMPKVLMAMSLIVMVLALLAYSTF